MQQAVYHITGHLAVVALVVISGLLLRGVQLMRISRDER